MHAMRSYPSKARHSCFQSKIAKHGQLDKRTSRGRSQRLRVTWSSLLTLFYSHRTCARSATWHRTKYIIPKTAKLPSLSTPTRPIQPWSASLGKNTSTMLQPNKPESLEVRYQTRARRLLCRPRIRPSSAFDPRRQYSPSPQKPRKRRKWQMRGRLAMRNRLS